MPTIYFRDAPHGHVLVDQVGSRTVPSAPQCRPWRRLLCGLPARLEVNPLSAGETSLTVGTDCSGMNTPRSAPDHLATPHIHAVSSGVDPTTRRFMVPMSPPL